MLIPNIGRASTKRAYTTVELDQTFTHLHQVPNFGIILPQSFDMAKYKQLYRAGRIDYAEQKLSRNTSINYQNEIGKSISPLFGSKKSHSVPGFAGKHKQNTEVTIQPQSNNIPNNNIFNII